MQYKNLLFHKNDKEKFENNATIILTSTGGSLRWLVYALNCGENDACEYLCQVIGCAIKVETTFYTCYLNQFIQTHILYFCVRELVFCVCSVISQL